MANIAAINTEQHGGANNTKHLFVLLMQIVKQ